VIGHYAVCQDVKQFRAGLFTQNFQEPIAATGISENWPAVVTAEGNKIIALAKVIMAGKAWILALRKRH